MLRMKSLLVSVLPHAAQMRPDSDPRQHTPERLPNKLKRSQNMQMIVDIAIHYGYLPYGPISYLPFLNSFDIVQIHEGLELFRCPALRPPRKKKMETKSPTGRREQLNRRTEPQWLSAMDEDKIIMLMMEFMLPLHNG
jgi:hypothetical protein